jgi:hypothetical protein
MARHTARASEKYPWKDGWLVLDLWISMPNSAPTSKLLGHSAPGEKVESAQIANKAIKRIMSGDAIAR